MSPASRQLLVDAVYKVRTDTDEAMKKVRGLGRQLKPGPNQPLNVTELATALGVHRSTIYEWKKLGLPLGLRTTVEQCRKWLEEIRPTAAQEAEVEERRRQLKARERNKRGNVRNVR